MLEVREMRKARGWTQTELAYHARLAPSVISEIENGKRNPSAGTLRKLAKAFGVEVRDLFPLGQAPLPDFEQWQGFDAETATMAQYASLRDKISGFDNLGQQERHTVLEDSLQLFQNLRQVHNPENRELALLHDIFYQAVLRMVGVYELEQERGNAGAEVVDINEYKALLKQSA